VKGGLGEDAAEEQPDEEAAEERFVEALLFAEKLQPMLPTVASSWPRDSSGPDGAEGEVTLATQEGSSDTGCCPGGVVSDNVDDDDEDPLEERTGDTTREDDDDEGEEDAEEHLSANSMIRGTLLNKGIA
jgi:hypothetical protein